MLRLSFGAALGLALLLLTLQFFLTPVYLEMEYEFAGFPPPSPLTSDQRYTAAQAFLSYLNVEIGGATLLSLSELRFDHQPFFANDDLACILRAKAVRGSAFGLTFVMGLAAIALWLFMAADDFERARRALITSAAALILIYTAFSLLARFAFPALAPLLAMALAAGSCAPARAAGLAQLFPADIVRDALVLLALFARFEAAVIIAGAWGFGKLMRWAQSPARQG
ncbi:MAG: hypothetical protein HY259_02910, partial [Chloroflexi bacterium]|nr:hypothetical protein [Chloroflexota bacterium]